MTAKQMMNAIGQHVELRHGSLHVACKVLDVKTAWGTPRLLVEPLSGSGNQWVDLSSVTLSPSTAAIMQHS